MNKLSYFKNLCLKALNPFDLVPVYITWENPSGAEVSSMFNSQGKGPKR